MYKTCNKLAAISRKRQSGALQRLVFLPSVPPCQVVGGRVAAVHRRLWTGGGAEADGALRSHRIGRGKSSSPRRVQTPPEAKAHGALQQRHPMWTGLGCWRLGRGLLLFFHATRFYFPIKQKEFLIGLREIEGKQAAACNSKKAKKKRSLRQEVTASLNDAKSRTR